MKLFQIVAMGASVVSVAGCVTGMPYIPPGTVLTPPMGYPFMPQYGYMDTYPEMMPDTAMVVESEPVIVDTQPVARSTSKRRGKGHYRCSDIGYDEAQELLSQGHRYLDRDNDGEACESSR